MKTIVPAVLRAHVCSTQISAIWAAEMLSLGVLGKIALWNALQSISSKPEPLLQLDIDELLSRARSQYAILDPLSSPLQNGALVISGMAHILVPDSVAPPVSTTPHMPEPTSVLCWGTLVFVAFGGTSRLRGR